MGAQFNDKPYCEVNREERHYCFLLGHALLADGPFRTAFCAHLASLGIAPTAGTGNLALDAGELQVFVEAAVLRDYWADLGTPGVPEVEERRLAILEQLLQLRGLPIDDIHRVPGFKTSTGKIWSPARWSFETVLATYPELAEVRRAFNAKPDLMLVSPHHQVVLIEAKVHSGMGTYGGDGDEGVTHKQTETQVDVSRLLRQLVPAFQDSAFFNLTLGLKPNASKSTPFDIRWNDVVEMLRGTESVDKFTVNSLAQLADSTA